MRQRYGKSGSHQGLFTFITDMTAPTKLGHKHKNKDTNSKGWSVDQFSESQTSVSRSAIILKIVIIIRCCMADELNRQALPVHHTKPYKNYNFRNDGTSRYFGLWLWKLVHLLNLVSSFQWCILFMCLIKLSRAALPWQRSINTNK